MTRNQIKLGKRYVIPSGMGGIFDARALDFTDDGLVRFRVDMPRNPDWHGYVVCVSPEEVHRES